jgi:hypothetical protein
MRIRAFLFTGVFLVWAASAWALTLAWDPPTTGSTPTGYRLYVSSTGMAADDFEMVWEGPELTCEVEVEASGKYVFYVTAYLVDGDETLESAASRKVFYRTSASTAINVTNPVQARTDGQGVTGSFH